MFGPDGRPDHFDVLLDPGWIWYRHVRTIRLIEEVARLLHARSVKWSIPSIPVGSAPGGEALDEESARRMARSLAGGPPFSSAEVAACSPSRHRA